MILKSCGSSQDVASIANESEMNKEETISGTYILEELGKIKVTKELTLKFDAKTNVVSGFSGCNHFSGNYSIDGNSISFSERRTTMMMCEGEANQLEQKMFNMLAKANSFELSNGQLKLKNDDSVLSVANETIVAESRQSGTNINVTYKATTRGFFEMIWVENNVLKYTNDRNLKDISRHELSEAQFSEVMTLYQNLDLESLPSLEPPSKTFQYDAAAFATLEVNEGEKTYKTNGFDHGNPPKQIALFVEKILSIKEKVGKQ